MNAAITDTTNCPSCGEPGKLFLEIPYTFDGHRFSLHACDSCELIYTYPFPSDALLREIYSGEYWTREKTTQKQGSIGGLVNWFNEIRLAATVQPLLQRLPSGASILEVGCGSGQLAKYLKRKGYGIEVTDISREILKEIRESFGIAGYCGSLEAIDFPHDYDAIIFNNVLEHLTDPRKALEVAGQLLTSKGLVFAEVPNIASIQFRLFRDSWFPLQIPEHLFHFSPNTLQKTAWQASLKMIWHSTFSPRISAAGYPASIFPALRPEQIRRSWSKKSLFLYLSLQIAFLPLALLEAWIGRGSAIRALFTKECLS